MSDFARQLLNRVILGDVMDTLKALPNNSIDMVWGDPDYGVGISYNGTKYMTRWEEYIQWHVDLAREAMRVLKPTGNLFMMNYPKQNAHLRVKYLDNAAHDVFEYVWVYPTNVGHSKRRLTTAHRSILHATKSSKNNFYKEQIAQPYLNPEDKRIKERISNGSPGRVPYSWMHHNLVKNVSKEKTFHACQIPQAPTEMIIKSYTKEGDSVFVLFGSSGSEVEVAKKLNRNYLTCEMKSDYYEVICDRLESGKIKNEYRLMSVK